MPYKKNDSFLPFTSVVFFFLFLIFSFISSYSQNKKDALLFVLKGTTKLATKKSIAGVELELKKDGKSVTKVTSANNGKYYLEMEISTVDPKNDYVLYISKTGTIPKTLIINAFVPQAELEENSFEHYDFDLEVVVVETDVKDIVVEKPSGKIHWDNNQHIFVFDQDVFAKVIQKEEEKSKENVNKPPIDLAAEKKKAENELAKKKEEDELAKKKEEELAKKKEEDELAKKKEEDELAKKKAKDDSLKLVINQKAKNSIIQNTAAIKKHRQDSIDSLASLHVVKRPVDKLEKLSKPVSSENVDLHSFNSTDIYSINLAKKYLNASHVRMNKEKATNLSAKYETNNVLTSLLDMVDEHDKKLKKQ